MTVNIFFTNWRRRSHLYRIIEAIKSQTLVPNIFVIDNASTDPENRFELSSEYVKTIKSDNSKMCWERWLCALDFPSQYSCIMDDDIVPTTNTVIEKCFDYMEQNQKVDAIGAYGVKYLKQLGYFKSEHTYCKHKDVEVPILKGRFIFARNSSLSSVDKQVEPTCDDIKVSSFLKKKILPGCLVNSFEDLPTGTEALSAKSFQFAKREYAANKYFK